MLARAAKSEVSDTHTEAACHWHRLEQLGRTRTRGRVRLLCATFEPAAPGQCATVTTMPGSCRGQDCAQCPATVMESGGLVSAALQGVPRASRLCQASITIYSAVAGRELLPKAVRDKVFVRDYSDPAFTADKYKQSKIT